MEKYEEGLDFNQILPREISLYIVLYLDWTSLIAVSSVCRYMNALVNEDLCWKIAYQRFWKSSIECLPTLPNINKHANHPQTWKEFFRIRYLMERFIFSLNSYEIG